MMDAYAETLRYLYQSLPMYQRIGAPAYKADLVNTQKLCRALGNPENRFKSLHVAGTNGKGSSSHMLAAILQAAGYKTGLYTSPHLRDFTERIKVNGQEISRSFVIDFVRRLKPLLEDVQPSFFETTVAMAFDYFVQQAVDIAVIEVGLGGRLDSTNVITPQLSLITNISFDHKDLLGDTLYKIASEKAGIIKQQVPVVISEHQSEVESVFVDRARSLEAPIVFASDHLTLAPTSEGFDVYRDKQLWLKDIRPALRGLYQQKNIPGVLQSVVRLKMMGYRISEEALRNGIANVVSLTGLKGRWQTLSQKPLTICDTGHNPAGIQMVVEQIRATPHRKLHMVFGVVKDKDLNDVFGLLPADADYYFCQANIPRALDAYDLAAKAGAAGLRGVVERDVNQALRRATEAAGPDDLIFVGGSTFVVAELENL
ncbi:MAG TPA: folylpolyglutamate synthase/dihydrofolate synthase family protein [Cyclobacteriaceae bacterium]|nr:folylpolyglutamate synthase/dihydrofolate synthase family protein [Cyclobacteriaceae bacterium]